MARQSLVDPGDIIIGAWENFRKHARSYAEFTALYVLVGVVVWATSSLMRTASVDSGLRFTSYVLVALPASLVYAILTAALIDTTAKALSDKKFAVGDQLLLGGRKLLPFIWASFLAALTTSIGFVLLIIPGILFFVWFRFAAYSAVIDGVGGTASLAASRSLVYGRWWAVFTRSFLPAFFYFLAAWFGREIIYLLAGAILGDPSLFFSSKANPEDLTNIQNLVLTLVPLVVQGLSLPLFLASDLILWLDLKRTARA